MTPGKALGELIEAWCQLVGVSTAEELEAVLCRPTMPSTRAELEGLPHVWRILERRPPRAAEIVVYASPSDRPTRAELRELRQTLREIIPAGIWWSLRGIWRKGES